MNYRFSAGSRSAKSRCRPVARTWGPPGPILRRLPGRPMDRPPVAWRRAWLGRRPSVLSFCSERSRPAPSDIVGDAGRSAWPPRESERVGASCRSQGVDVVAVQVVALELVGFEGGQVQIVDDTVAVDVARNRLAIRQRLGRFSTVVVHVNDHGVGGKHPRRAQYDTEDWPVNERCACGSAYAS